MSTTRKLTIGVLAISAALALAAVAFAVTYNGTPGNDSFIGGSANDIANMFGGNDYADGNGGSDQLIGGDGADELHGGPGSDFIEGNRGPDLLYGEGSPSNHLRGLDGDDILRSVNGYTSDVLDCGNGTDAVHYEVDTSSGDADQLVNCENLFATFIP